MIKKTCVTALILLALYSLTVLAFRIAEPKDIGNDTFPTNIIDYRTLDDYLLSSGNGTVHYLLFYSKDNADSLYLHQTVLSSLSNQTSLDINHLIEIIDLTPLDEENRILTIREDWDVANYPFFACVKIENQTIVPLSVLTYDVDHPLKASDIEAWLSDNGVYSYSN